MSMSLQLSAKAGVLDVTATGSFSLPEAKRTFLEMLEAVVQSKVDKVLFDGCALGGNPQVIERFYYGKFAARAVTDIVKRGVCPAPKFAYVLKEPVLDPRRLGETVARNRGMNVKAFDEFNEARAWLNGAPYPE